MFVRKKIGIDVQLVTYTLTILKIISEAFLVETNAIF